MATQAHEQDVKYLNNFLRNELSAVETYSQCIDKADDANLSSSLASLQQSHQKRAQLLRQRVESLGGSPADSTGMWGSISKLMQAGSNLFGEKTAISNLEEGEDQGRDAYKRDLDKLSPENRQFIESEILPEQMRTHDVMHDLERNFKQLH